jgi:hypothetical protein
MKLTALLVCALLVPAVSDAQEPQAPAAPADAVENLPVPSWAKAIVDSFSKPLHPVIGGVATNGGVGVGVGYNSPGEEEWFQNGRAMFTVRRFWVLEGEVGRRSLSNRAQFGGFGAVRHMGRVDYFGIGPDTDLSDRAAFGLRETTVGARGWFRPIPAVRLGGTVSAYLPDLGRTNSSRIRPIDSVFPDVPGILSEPTFGRYRGFVELRHPAPVAESVEQRNHYRGAYQLAFESVRDYSTGRHNLYRWEFETQQRLPGFTPDQRLTLHGFFATTNRTADVPFYLLYSLGGTGGLKTFRPDMLGGDGTRATLRGFRNFRFRDRDLVLMQAEYRIPIHKYVETSVFVDTGQVAPRPSELFSNLRANTGFSVSAVRKGKTLGRLDVGFGGGEGVYFYWSFGAFQE